MRAILPIALAVAAVSTPATAGEIRAFDAGTFGARQARNEPTIIFVHADWCPICRAQEQTIRKLIATTKYKEVSVLRIDYDTQKALWRKFGAKQQSTLIAFHGQRETARLAYNSDPEKVTAVLASALR
jgi:thioredoxin-like negative regulator of GroEL